jgi:hypothetical protein
MHPRTQEIASLVAVPAGATRAVLRLAGAEPSATVGGRVLTWGGAPVADALIRVQRRLARPDGRSVFRAAPLDFFARTDAEGRYRFESLPLEGTSLLLNGEMVATAQTLALADAPDLEDVVFRVPERCWLRVVLADPSLADTLCLLDESGESLMLTVKAGSVMLGADVVSLEGGRSDLIQTDRSARTLVLYARDEEVLRTTLELRPDEVNEISL